MKRIVKKIRKIKEDRLTLDEKLIIKSLRNLKEEVYDEYILYKNKNNVNIIRYHIDSQTLYFNCEIYDEYVEILYKRLDDDIIFLDTSEILLDLIRKNLNKSCIKKKYTKDIENILLEDGIITHNPLFNSITGECSNIKRFFPILVP